MGERKPFHLASRLHPPATRELPDRCRMAPRSPERRRPRKTTASEALCWLRGLDLNQRPLGYEPNPARETNRAGSRADEMTWAFATRVRSRLASSRPCSCTRCTPSVDNPHRIDFTHGFLDEGLPFTPLSGRVERVRILRERRVGCEREVIWIVSGAVREVARAQDRRSWSDSAPSDRPSRTGK